MKKIIATLSVVVISSCVYRTTLKLNPEIKSVPKAVNFASKLNKKVTVAPIVIVQSSVKEEIFEQNGHDFEKWVEAQRSAVSGEVQDSLVNNKYNWTNVKIVDPNDTPHIYGEINDVWYGSFNDIDALAEKI